MKRLLVVLSAIVFEAVSISAQTTVGYVLEIEGTWILNGSRSLTQGEKVPAAGSIRLEPNASRGSHITISDMGYGIIKKLNCSVDSCSRAFVLPRPAPAGGLGNYLYKAAMDLIWGSPTRFKAHRSRNGELADGVLLLKDGRVDFSSLINQSGDNYLRWRAVSADEPDNWSAAVKLERTPGGFAPFADSQLKAGLYEVDLLRKSGPVYESLATAWVLVREAGSYDRSLASFREAAELSKGWGNKVRPETTRSFLRAYLASLEQTAEP